MKKMKFLLLTIVVITAVTGSFAAKKKFDCFDQPQYYKGPDGVYHWAGTFAVDYYCYYTPVTYCTYIWEGGNIYTPCRYGHFVFVPE